jgi:hypothetical protein
MKDNYKFQIPDSKLNKTVKILDREGWFDIIKMVVRFVCLCYHMEPLKKERFLITQIIEQITQIKYIFNLNC